MANRLGQVYVRFPQTLPSCVRAIIQSYSRHQHGGIRDAFIGLVFRGLTTIRRIVGRDWRSGRKTVGAAGAVVSATCRVTSSRGIKQPSWLPMIGGSPSRTNFRRYQLFWRPVGDSNPCYRRERAVGTGSEGRDFIYHFVLMMKDCDTT